MIRFIIFVIMLYGLFLVFHISILNLAVELFDTITKQQTKLLSERIKGKKINPIIAFFKEIKYMLIYTGREKSVKTLCFISASGAIAGLGLSLAIHNVFLALPLGIILLMVPFIYIQIHSSKWLNQINREMESALSLITESYKRRGNIILAIEENIKYLNPPMLAIFENFVKQTRFVNSDVKVELENLKEQVHSKVFGEWINALIDCQDDKNMMVTLTPIVQKISYLREISSEVKAQIYAPVKTFFTIMIIGLLVFPLCLYLIQPEWLMTLFTTTIGRITLAVGAVVISITSWRVLKIAKQAEIIEME